MRTSWISNVSQSDDAEQNLQAKRPVPRDADLLDAYSQAVVQVVRQVGPAVLTISGEGKQGVGSGFVITPRWLRPDQQPCCSVGRIASRSLPRMETISLRTYWR